MPKNISGRLSLTMDVELLDRIDSFRFSRKYMSRSAAMRDLMIYALDQIDGRKPGNSQKSNDSDALFDNIDD